MMKKDSNLLLLVGLLGSLGSLSSNLLGGGGLHRKSVSKGLNTQQAIINHLDDTDGNGLPHVPDGEPSKGRELSEGLDAHGCYCQ